MKREKKRNTCQRIQKDPTSHLAKSLQLSSQRRDRKLALQTTDGKLLRTKQFEKYLNTNMT